ncbi:MAG: hypothetical protein B7X86_10815 [Sphingobacteriales bacterium 17-39-43]|nr:MAG: hypothetical protein B7Y76_00835 [Sphingobacteriia bacterium 35-40-5]OYZ31121.1 MAG: hypothetical protein B7Y24_10755 [Sphingobacteriales bacterium 16-39-50]OZA23962.1 MAG: hypothetical protein B7X86_10815 [Sphingobacteriales bacterium 17-39-43]
MLNLRKLTAIFFLLLFLFNIAGYKGLFFFLTQSADERLAEKIKDGNDLDKDMIMVKFPFNVPYLSDSKDFESMEGEVNLKGTIYKYVKRKIARDTLFLICIENKEKTLIEKKRAEYFNKVNDLDASTSKKTGAKQIKLEYYFKNSEISLKDLYVLDFQSPHSFVINSIQNGHYYLFAPPPESLLS